MFRLMRRVWLCRVSAKRDVEKATMPIRWPCSPAKRGRRIHPIAFLSSLANSKLADGERASGYYQHTSALSTDYLAGGACAPGDLSKLAKVAQQYETVTDSCW